VDVWKQGAEENTWPEREEVAGGREDYMTRSFITCMLYKLVRWSNKGVIRWVGQVARMRRRMHTKFWSESLKGRDYSKYLGIDEKIILKCILRTGGGNMWSGFIWLMTGTRDGFSWTHLWNVGFNKRRGISWLAEWLLASQEGLCSM
jgi:hypothetical protein